MAVAIPSAKQEHACLLIAVELMCNCRDRPNTVACSLKAKTISKYWACSVRDIFCSNIYCKYAVIKQKSNIPGRKSYSLGAFLLSMQKQTAADSHGKLICKTDRCYQVRSVTTGVRCKLEGRLLCQILRLSGRISLLPTRLLMPLSSLFRQP